MEHWFDNLTKRLAGVEHTRRAMLGWSLRAALGAAAAALSGRFGRATAAAAPSATPAAGNCEVCLEGRDALFSLTTTSTFNGKPITFKQTSRVIAPHGATEFSWSVRLDGEDLLSLSTTRKGACCG